MLQGKRIFVVEDDIMSLTITTHLLSISGAVVYKNNWGVDTIEHVRQALPIDLVLLDLMFPRGISGYDIFDHLKSTPELSGIPVVAVTACDPVIEMNRARDKGFAGYIEKPIDRTRFVRQISMVIDGTPVWGD